LSIEDGFSYLYFIKYKINCIFVIHLNIKTMAKSRDAKKKVKKEPAKTAKEKKEEKRLKKNAKKY